MGYNPFTNFLGHSNGYPPASLTASLPLKNDGSPRSRSFPASFLLGPGIFSGANSLLKLPSGLPQKMMGLESKICLDRSLRASKNDVCQVFGGIPMVSISRVYLEDHPLNGVIPLINGLSMAYKWWLLTTY